MINKETDFKRHIKSKEYKSIYLISGDEKFLIKHYTNMLVKAVMGDVPPEFNFHSFDNDSTVDEMVVAVDVMPFMSEYNFVKITDYNIDKLKKSDLDNLKEMIKNIPSTSIVVFTYPTLDNSGKEFKAIQKMVDKLGIAVELKKYDSHALSKKLVDAAYKRGCTITLNNAGKIVDYCGTDLTALQNEIEKLSAYADGGEITLDMINSLVHINLETKIYSLSDFIMSGNLNKAFRELDILFNQGEDEHSIIRWIGYAYTDLYRSRVMAESGVPIDVFAKDFSYGNNKFKLTKAAKNGRSLSTIAIRKSIDEIIATEHKTKSVSGNNRVRIERLVARLSLIAREN